MHIPLLADVVIVLLVSVAVLYIFHRVRLPPVVGFLVSGILVGPYGLGLVQGIHEVEQLAEVGVILLLFTIGLEFSFEEILRMKRTVLVGGSLQLLGVLAGVWGILALAGIDPDVAFFLGLTASLSSTAVVLRLLQQRGEMEAPQGRTSLAVLIYQDLMIVPMMLLVPFLAGTGGGLGASLAAFAGKAALILVSVVILGRYVVPGVLERVVHTRSRDLFLLSVVAVCLVVAWAGSIAGLSLPLGAFLAGLIVSESEYSHQALADVIPFRDLFAAFFFVSIGMLLDLGLVVANPLLVLALTAGLLFVKGVVAAAAALALGLSLQTAVVVGLGLSQVGEFSFILAASGLEEGLLGQTTFEWFLVVAVLTMGVTPLLMAVAPRVAGLLARLPLAGPLDRRPDPGAVEPDTEDLSDHVVVVGFGLNGRNIAWAARVAGIPHTVVDINPAVVRDEQARDVPIHFGDATQSAVLSGLGVGRARVVVVAISDAAATRQITAQARLLNPGCYIITRTRYLAEVDPLREVGADLVIPEELETSVEIVSRVMAHYLVSRREIESFVGEIRAGGYEMLRSLAQADSSLADLEHHLTDVEVSTLLVDPGSPLVGHRLQETELRRLYGITVVAARRGDDLLPNPGADFRVEAGDHLIVLGLPEEIAAASELFRRAISDS